MKTFFTILLMITTACGGASSVDTEWHSSTDDFESKKISLTKGKHILFAVSDRPVTCAMYREAQPLAEMHVEGNSCSITFDSFKDESLVFVIRLDAKDGKPGFKYHASLI